MPHKNGCLQNILLNPLKTSVTRFVLAPHITKKTKELFAAADRSLFEGFTDEELDGYINCIEKIYHNIRKQLPGAECCGGKANEKMV